MTTDKTNTATPIRTAQSFREGAADFRRFAAYIADWLARYEETIAGASPESVTARHFDAQSYALRLVHAQAIDRAEAHEATAKLKDASGVWDNVAQLPAQPCKRCTITAPGVPTAEELETYVAQNPGSKLGAISVHFAPEGVDGSRDSAFYWTVRDALRKCPGVVSRHRRWWPAGAE